MKISRAEQIRTAEFQRIMLAPVASLPLVRVTVEAPTHTVTVVIGAHTEWVNVHCRVERTAIYCGGRMFSRETGNEILGMNKVKLDTLRELTP